MLTRRAVVTAAVLSVVAAVLPVSPPLGLAVADGSLLVLVALDWLLAARPSSITVQRSLPASLALDEEGNVEWTVTNPSSRRLRVAIADELARSLGADRRRVELAVPPHASAVAATGIQPRRRGDFHPTAVVVRVWGPLGLGARQANRRLPGHLRVVPMFRSRREAELRMDRTRLLEVGLRSARFRGGGSEFDQLKEYTPDDESRRIDWSATARSARPIVRTYRAERNQVVNLMLDNGRIMAGQIGGVPRVEHAMDAAMTVTAVATRFGDRVGLVAFDRDVRATVPPGASTGQLGRVVDALYRLEPELVESDYRRAFLDLSARRRRRSLIILLSDLADQALDQTLLPYLPLLTRSHLVVVGAARDPEVEDWASARPSEAGTAYRKAAAIEALERRDRVAAQLAERGVSVVDAPPGRLGARLADFYLDVKASARL